VTNKWLTDNITLWHFIFEMGCQPVNTT
jgi:hypothetical protein